MRSPRVFLFAFLALVVTAGPVKADTFFEDFTVLNPSTLALQSDFGQWTLASVGGQLRISKPAGGPTSLNQGAVVPKFWMHGDFDVQVAYRLYVWGTNNQAQINLFSSSTFLFAMRRNAVAVPYPGDYSVHTPSGGNCGTTFTGDLVGYMRVTRSGTNITGWSRTPGGGWTAVCTRNVGTMPLAFNLNGQNNTGNPACDVGYDSLYVSAADLEWWVGTGVATVTPGPAPSCISIANTCVNVPVDIARTSAENMRGFSVKVQLSSNLELCAGTASITEGTYLSGAGSTTFQIIDNGGGSYTVDGAILGLPCGATTASGNLFNLAVKKKLPNPDGTGTITISDVVARDCNNLPLSASAGAPLSLTIDTSAPSAIAALTAAQVKTGNDADGTTKVTVAWPAAEAGATVRVYRAPFGNHPEYDDAPGAGSVPVTPSYPPGGPWTLAASVAGPASFADEVGTRDFWYYVAFVEDPCGNVSAVSNQTGGTLNYHLGDTHDGTTNCAGNNLVNTSDISFLGANYGIALGASDPLGCLDVGPTTDFSVDARPTTDNQVQFEDLMMFAINHGQVSAPQARLAPAAAARDAVGLQVPALPAPGNTFAVGLAFEGTGRVQGVSAMLGFDARVVEFLGVERGALADAQGSEVAVLSSRAGNVDVAALGTGAALLGEGEIARARFRVRAAGDPAIAIRSLDGRDRDNRAVALIGGPASGNGSGAALPARTALSFAGPNPFRDATALELALAERGPVSLAVYGIDGRRVRALADGAFEPGTHRFAWNGRDDAGREVPAGMYFVRLTTGTARLHRALVRVK